MCIIPNRRLPDKNPGIHKQGLDHGETLNNTKEYIAILVSLENGCTMCVGEHERIAKLLGITEEQINRIKEGFESADLQETERELLRFCITTHSKYLKNPLWFS